MIIIQVTYQYPSAAGKPIRHSHLCTSREQADKVCREVEKRQDRGYKIIDVSRIE